MYEYKLSDALTWPLFSSVLSDLVAESIKTQVQEE